MTPRACSVGLALLCLGACAAAPLQYYTLTSPVASPAAAPAPPRWIDVLPVGVPAQVDAPQLVLRQGNGQLAVLERQQWAAPLAAEIRGALIAELARQAGVRDVHGLPPPADVPLHRLKLDVQTFETMPGRGVRWEAVWSLRGVSGSKLALTCVFVAGEAVGQEPLALVEGHQRILRRLAGQIAAALAQAAAGTPGTCPASSG